MIQSLLTVCIGNICRSPIAEGLFRHYAEENGLQMQVSSAGLGALVNHPADPFSVELMDEIGIDISQHLARQITPQIVAESELIITMESWQQRKVEEQFPFARGRVFAIGKWSDSEIADPYKKPREAFEVAFKGIQEGYAEWLEYL